MEGAHGGSWALVRALRGVVPEFLLQQGPNEAEAPGPGGGGGEPLGRQQPEAGGSRQVGLESNGLQGKYIYDWRRPGGEDLERGLVTSSLASAARHPPGVPGTHPSTRATRVFEGHHSLCWGEAGQRALLFPDSPPRARGLAILSDAILHPAGHMLDSRKQVP